MAFSVKKTIEKLKESGRFGFVKSFAVLLLAVVLLITSVFAWFTSGSSATATGMSISVVTPETVRVSDYGSLTITEQLYLPAATKANEVLQADLAKVILVRQYTITSSAASVTLNIPSSDITSGLHYHIDTSYDGGSGDTPDSYAEVIKSDPSTVVADTGSGVVIDLTDSGSSSTATIAIVFWADYDSAWNNNSTGSKNYSISLSFEA